jgi:uncharacterized protein YcnI
MRSTRLAVALSATSLLLLASPAFAHVTVNAPGATQGGFTKLTFRVPTEKDVPTTKLEIVFPDDAPLAFASVKPHAGWTYVVVKKKLAEPIKSDDGDVTEAVSTITWTATSGGIKPGEFDEFEVSAGPLPKAEKMVFKALQTYGDGETVRWIESGEDAEHPAPTLTLAAAATEDGTHHSGGSATPTASASPAATVTASHETDHDDHFGIAGTALGGVALLVALAAFFRTRRA